MAADPADDRSIGPIDSRVTVTGARGPSTAATTTVASPALDAWQPQRLEDLTALHPSATTDVADGGLSTAIKLRGFGVTRLYADGLPDTARMFVRDLATVDAVRFLSGPQTAAYGLASPGGVVDYRLKQAVWADRSRAEVTLGSGHWRRAVVDLNRHALATASEPDAAPASTHLAARTHTPTGWAWRVVAAMQGGQSQPASLPLRQQVVLGTVLWSPLPDAQLTLALEEQRSAQPFSFGTVISNGLGATAAAPRDAEVRYDQRYVLPGGAPTLRIYHRMALTAAWATSATLHWRAALQRARVARDETLVGFWSLESPTELSGYTTTYQDRYRQWDGRVQLHWQTRLGDVPHEVTAGLDSNRSRWRFDGVQSIDGFRLSVAQPDFSTVNTAALATTPRINREQRREAAVWATDRMQVHERLQLSLGLRALRYHVASDRTGAGPAPVAQGQGLAGSAQLDWRLAAGLATSLAYGEGQQPNRGLTREGQFLPAERSHQLEWGARWWAPEHSLRLAAYRLVQAGVAMRDPQDRNAVVADGARRVLGWDAALQSAWGAWTWQALGNRLNSRQIVRTSATLGDAFVGVPPYSARLQATWRSAAGLQLWLAAAHTGPRFADAANTTRLAGHTLLHGGAQATLQPGLVLQLGVRNATNRRHVEGVTALDDVYAGALRQWWVTARWAL